MFPCRWGATFYTVGVALYILAIASTIVNDCPNTLFTPVEYVSVGRFPQAAIPGCTGSE